MSVDGYFLVLTVVLSYQHYIASRLRFRKSIVKNSEVMLNKICGVWYKGLMM
jgi:hypothetical protein